MNRRTLIGAAAAVAAFPVPNPVASAQTSLKTKNVVFVHGLFADGSCWSKVIARLQQKGINCELPSEYADRVVSNNLQSHDLAA